MSYFLKNMKCVVSGLTNGYMQNTKLSKKRKSHYISKMVEEAILLARVENFHLSFFRVGTHL